MKFVKTGFKDLTEIYPKVFKDDRGLFFESWNKNVFTEHGINYEFKQDNQSISQKNVLRGLHFQVPPHEQGKLVRVASGKALDVVVDLRKNETTYGKHHKVILSAEENNMLWVPPGFAHAFLALENNTIFVYKCSGLYNKESERIIKWDDDYLDIDWGVESPIVSEKDKEGVCFSDYRSPF